MNECLQFGSFSYNVKKRLLWHNSQPVPLKPKEAELLSLLVESNKCVLLKGEIIERLWPHHAASDAALAQTVYRLRRALARRDPRNSYIETIYGVGFTFLENKSSTSGKPVVDRPPSSLYRRAMRQLDLNDPDSLLKSIGTFREVLDGDCNDIDALLGNAQAYVDAGIRSIIDPAFAYSQAKHSLDRALKLSPTCADTYAALALLYLFFDADRREAHDLTEHALALAPDSIIVRIAATWERVVHNDTSGAIEQATVAASLRPASANLAALLGAAFYMAGRYREAHQQLDDALDLSPSNSMALYYSACAYIIHGEYQAAVERLNRIDYRELRSRVMGLRGYMVAKTTTDWGCDDALSLLASISGPTHVATATIHIARGDNERATLALEAAIGTREPGLLLILFDPMYRSLHVSHRWSYTAFSSIASELAETDTTHTSERRRVYR